MQPLPPPPPPPAQNSDPAAQLLLLKQGINERFKDYRLAMLGTTNVSQIPVFKQIGAFGGYSSSVLRKVKQRARSGLRFYKGPVDLSPQAANARTKSKLDQARVLLNKEARKLWAAGLRYKRTLGAGGQGVAAVFQARNAHGETVDVVGKLVLPGTMGPGAMTDEKNLAAVYMRAPHIVQMFDWDAFFDRDRALSAPPPAHAQPHTAGTGTGQTAPVQPTAPSTEDRDAVRTDPGILVTECGRFKDLDQMLNMAAWKGHTFPDRALWGLFRCLVLGITALEYPPRHQVDKWTHLPWGPPLPEEIPDPVRSSASTIHFDLDPRNIIVFDFDDGEHKHTPAIKIGDLGLAVRFSDPSTLSSLERWEYRWQGKPGWMTPEQFSSDWERPNESFLNPKTKDDRVAGHYRGATMNTWQAAMVIWCCITLCQPEIPPVPEHVEIQLPAGSPGPTKFLTYGAYILDPRFAAVDEDIRHTVLWCLAHHPEDRPDLATLRRLVDAKGRSRGDAAAPTAAGPDAGLTDAELKRWFGLVLLEPGPKPLPKYDPNGPDDQINPHLD